MTSLTLKQVPEGLLEKLRQDADAERRSINQHALWLLERALGLRREVSFADEVEQFRQRHAESLSNALDVPRDRSPGRSRK